MSRRYLLLPLTALASVLGAPVQAIADEAYICDAGRIVYVKPGELEHLKRSDPCIAGYYGLTVEAPSKSEDGKATSQARETNASTAAVTKANGRMSKSVGRLGPAEKGLALERDALAAIKQADPIAAKPAVERSSEPLKTAIGRKSKAPGPPADFRNVVIINAAPGTDPIFRHEK